MADARRIVGDALSAGSKREETHVRAQRVLSLILSVALAAAVTLPPGSAVGRTPSAAVSRSSVKPAGAAPSKPVRPQGPEAPAAKAVPALRTSGTAPAEPSGPIVIDPLAPAVPGELVVVLDDGASAATSQRELEARGARVERVPGDGGSLLVKTPRGVNDPVFNVVASQIPGVDWVQPNYIYRADYTPADPRYHDQWGLPRIGAPAAWNVTRGDGTVLVAVVDTGIDAAHPDLAGRVDTANDYDFVNGDTNANDDNADGHGTHVAGIIAATEGNGIGTVGVAPRCRILPVKVLDSKGSGTSSIVGAGIRYAANNGAKVINLSVGGLRSADPLMGSAVAYAQGKGCVVVAAAGNEGLSGADYPARYADVIGVGAVDRLDKRASFSNYGEGLDVAAPGVDVLSTIRGGGYGYMSGTSMASPFVAGVAALVWSLDSGLGADEVIALVRGTAEDIGGADEYGLGLVRADRAVASSGAGADDDIPGVPIPASPAWGTLGSADRHDVFRVYLGEGQTLEATLTGGPGTDFDLTLYSPVATAIGSSTGRVAWSMYSYYPETIRYTATATGLYCLDVGMSAESVAGSYQLTWARTGYTDDNLPGVALPASPATGTLDSVEDATDVYRVDLEAGEQLTVAMDGPEGADFDLWLYGPGSTSIDADAPLTKRESSGASELLHYVATESGTYSVRVYAYSGSGAYTLRWGVGPFEEDDNIPGVGVTPSPIVGAVGTLEDMNDVYKLYLQAGQSVEVTLTDDSGAGTDPNLYVYGPTSTDVDVDPWVAEATSGEAIESLAYTAEATGYHYLDVYSGLERGGYSLEWSTAHVPDDNIPGVGAPSAPVAGQLGVTTDTDDVYRIHAYMGETIAASLAVPSQNAAGADFDLYLFGPGSTDVRIDAPMTAADGAAYPKTIGFAVTETGDYFLLAHAFAGESTYAIDWRLTATMGMPRAPSTATHRRLFTVYGYVAPKHSSGTYLATVRFYKKDSHGDYVYHHSVKARRYYHSSASTKYRVSTSLPSAGRWRLRAYHADSRHAGSYSAYRYITVR